MEAIHHEMVMSHVASTPAAAPAQHAPVVPEVTVPAPKAKATPELARQLAAASMVDESEDAVEARVEQAVDQMNEVMSTFDKGLRFRVHSETDRPYVEVVNRQTDEVVKTFPSEEMLDLMSRVHNVLGMILDTEG